MYQTKHKQVSFLLVRHSKSLVLKKFEIKGCGWSLKFQKVEGK